MNGDGWDDGGSGRPLLSERMRRLGTPVGIVLAAVMVVFLSYQGPMIGAIAAFVGTIVVVIWLRNRSKDEDEGEGYGPGARDGSDRTR